MANRPTGTVTFLFTDVVDSTRSWEIDPATMAAALARHDELARTAFQAHRGVVFATAGDSFAVAFDDPDDAVDAAVELQAALADEPWPPGGAIRIRAGINSGVAYERGGDYFGPPVNLAARVMGLAPAGEILLGPSTAALVRGRRLRHHGEHRLKGITAPQRISSVPSATETSDALVLDDAAATNLPRARDALIGREHDLEAIIELAQVDRLVTIVGPGGVGKTRLALAVAAALRSKFDLGTWFADLRLANDGRSVASVVANALGLRADDSLEQVEQVTQYVSGRSLLLVLDNCEHVVDEVAALVDALVDLSGDLVVLATSREPLEVRGESVYVLEPLAAHDQHSAAVTLFVERARTAGRPVPPDERVMADVVALCRRLDGLPLAIELAAARARTLDPGELLGRIGERFELLAASRRARQRGEHGLREVIDWSYRLLDEHEQHVLRSLSVFSGSFSIAAVAAVADRSDREAVDLVDSLVAKSLVVVERAEGGQLRYRLLETIRAFALEKLDESAERVATRDRHADYFASFAAASDATQFNTLRERDRQRAEFTELLAAAAHLDAERPASAADLLYHLSYDAVTDHGASLQIAEAATRLVGRLEPLHASRAIATHAIHAIFGGAYGSALRAARAAHAYRDIGDPDAVAETRLFEANVIAPVQPLEALAICDDVRDTLIDRCGRRRAYLVVAEKFIRATVELGRRRFPEALALAEEVIAHGDFDGWVSTICDAEVGFIRHLLGRTDYRPQSLTPSTYSSYPAAAAALTGAYDDPDLTRHRLARVAAEACDGRIPLQEASFLVYFGRCAWIAGETDHARRLFAMGATRIPTDSSLLLETLTALEGWSNDEFPVRAFEFMSERERRHRALHGAPALLRDEVIRWGGAE